MKNLFSGAPWPASTIAIISILFTPIVGGVLLGLNASRLGYRRERWIPYLLSAMAFVVFSAYFALPDQRVAGGALFIPPFALLIALITPDNPSFLFLLGPLGVLIYAIYAYHRRLLRKAGVTRFDSPQTAYLLALLLTIGIGALLVFVHVRLALLLYG